MQLIERPMSDDLAALLVEYERLNLNGQNALTRLFTILTVGAGALGLVVSQVPAIQEKSALIAIYLSLPLAFTITFALVVEQLYAMIFEGYQARRVAKLIGELVDRPDVFSFPEAQARGLYSLRHAPVKHLLSYALIVTAIAGAYLGLTGYCLWGLLQNGAPWSVALGAGAVYALATGLALVGFHGSQFDSRRVFDQSFDQSTPVTSDPILVLRGLIYFVIPRLGDFVAKAGYYWIGVLGCVVAARITGSFHGANIVNGLPRIAVVFVIVEIGTNQSKLMLNDLRDRWTDRESPRKSGRLLAQHPSGVLPHLVAFTFLARVSITIAGALVVAVAWGYGIVPFLVLAIVGLQISYEWFGKDRYLRRVLVAGAGHSIRTLSGYWVASLAIGLRLHDAWPVGMYLAIWSLLLSIIFLGCYWRAEAEDYVQRGVKQPPRGLTSFLRCDRLMTGIAILSVVAALTLVVPLWFQAHHANSTWLAAAVPGALAPALIVRDYAARGSFPIGTFRSRLGRPLQLLLTIASVLTVVAAVAVTVLGNGDTGLFWLLALPSITGTAALFLLAATYDDFTVEPVLVALALHCIRLYRRVFVMDHPRAERA